MTPTTYQKPEIRDSNDNIIQQGAFGKNTALSNATNDGWIDYVANDLNFLYGLAKDEVVPVSVLPASGDMNKTYLLTTTGVCYRWDGTEWIEISSSEAVGRAEAAADLAEEWATKTGGTVDGTEYSAKHYSNVSKDWANKLNATVDGSEYSAKHYAGVAEGWAEDAEDTAEDIANHLAQIDQNTGGVSANSKRIGNIEKLLQGNLYDYQTENSSAYIKSVPAGAMPYAGLEKVGGKTVVWNQLVDPSRLVSRGTVSSVGLTQTTDGKGAIIINGTSTQANNLYVSNLLPLIGGHKYIIYCDKYSADWFFRIGSTNLDTSNGAKIVSMQSSINTIVYFYFANGVSFDNLSVRVQYTDLTLLYGAGNEPTTAEFQQMFPADYYEYNSGELLSAGVTEVVSKKADTTTIGTYPIPAEIQALEGYGWSAGTAYNYVDFERKVFVQNVVSTTYNGTEDWGMESTNNSYYYLKVGNRGDVVDHKVVCDSFETVTITGINTNIGVDVINSSGYDAARILIRPADMSGSKDDFKTWLASNNITVNYALSTPIETDISEYLTDDNLIQVESGGTLTFPNQNGTDYQIPVPSEETYMIDLQEAINNG